VAQSGYMAALQAAIAYEPRPVLSRCWAVGHSWLVLLRLTLCSKVSCGGCIVLLWSCKAP
jgi:hypothetical protein